MENFDVHIKGEKVEYIDLKHVMSFLEYIQTNDLDPATTLHVAVNYENLDDITVGNHLCSLLSLLRYLSSNVWFNKYASKCPTELLTVWDYYSGTDTDIVINGIALKMMIEESTPKLLSLFSTENQPQVQSKLISPLRLFRQHLETIVNTGTYRDYASGQKFATKYAGMQLNPQLLKL